MAKYLDYTALAELVSKTKFLIGVKGGVYRGTFGNWSTVPSSASGYEADANGNTTPLKDDYMILNDGSGKLDDSSFLYLSDTSGSRASIANTYNGNTQSVVYYNVTGENNATILNGVVSVYYNSNTGKWVVKTLKACTVNNVAYAVGDVIAQWGYSSYSQCYIAYAANTNGGIFVYDGVWSTDGKNGWKTAASIISMTTGIQNAINTKQDALTFDNLPSSGSSNPVKSGGVYAALLDKADQSWVTQYYAAKSSLATVATTGSYDDLTNKPEIPTGAVVDTVMSTTSTNPVQNKVISEALSDRLQLSKLPSTTPRPVLKNVLEIESSDGGIDFTNVGNSDTYVAQTTESDAQNGVDGLIITTSTSYGTNGLQDYLLNADKFAPIGYDNVSDLGNTTERWRNLYIGGNLTDGTNSISVANIVAKQNAITSTNKLDYSLIANTPTIPAAVTSIDGLSGGTLTSPLTLSGGDAATASKIILNTNGQITDTGTATLFGRSGTGSTLIVGHSSYAMTMRGSATRPTYNGNNMALSSDVPTNAAIVNLIYPVGSIYMSVNSTSPATLFGGTWVQLKDRFLLGAGDTYTNGNTGGAATVTLTEAQLPAHTHANTISVSASQAAHRHSLYSIGNNKDGDCSGFTNSGDNGVGGPHNGSSRSLTASTQDARGRYLMDTSTPTITVTKSITNASAGSGNAHNNMPPYLVVYMWKRTA